MKKFRKLSAVISIVLCMSIFFSGSVFASNITPKYIPDGMTLTIHAGYSSESSIGPNDFGHAFISVDNWSGRPITVGKLSVPSGMSVSLGTWNDDREHEGIYYNREFKLNDRTYWSYSEQLTDNKLSTLNSFILNNDSWSPSAPCSVFAARAWNSVQKLKFNSSYFTLPGDLSSAIEALNGAEYGAPIPSFGKVYHANGNGQLTLSIHN